MIASAWGTGQEANTGSTCRRAKHLAERYYIDMTTAATPEAATGGVIHKITIERFRGIRSLIWCPQPGVNIVLGGGDAGKTSILEAIALLLSPSSSMTVTDADYFERSVSEGFCIEAVMSLPDRVEMVTQQKFAWPWEWNGTEAVQPDLEREEGGVREPVFRVCVRGTEELDLEYEILQPDDSVNHFSVAVRRAIGLVRLSGDERNDRDLRMVHGSALDRLLSDSTLRARLGRYLSDGDLTSELKDEGKDALSALDATFAKKALPHGLGLGITSPQGVSLNALIGLTAKRGEVHLPLSSWGAGTRRLSALEIASIHHAERPLTVVDEIERGLEPYRQRLLLRSLQSNGAQVFVTTHSTVVLSASTGASFWYVDTSGNIGEIAKGATAHRQKQPEAYLARVAVIVEGATELGFVAALLARFTPGELADLGIVVSDACGNYETLNVLEALSRSGLNFAGFADDEGDNPVRWQKVKASLGPLLYRWPTGCMEANLINLVPDEQLEEFITPPDGKAGERLRTLAIRAGTGSKAYAQIKSSVPNIRELIIEASTGAIPDGAVLDDDEKKSWKRHSERWFKSENGGRELEMKVHALGLWPRLSPELKPFVDAVLSAAGAVDELNNAGDSTVVNTDPVPPA